MLSPTEDNLRVEATVNTTEIVLVVCLGCCSLCFVWLLFTERGPCSSILDLCLFFFMPAVILTACLVGSVVRVFPAMGRLSTDY